MTGDNVIFLRHHAPGDKTIEEEQNTVGACAACRNKTFLMIHPPEGFAMLRCAACGSNIGRIGWAPDDDEPA